MEDRGQESAAEVRVKKYSHKKTVPREGHDLVESFLS